MTATAIAVLLFFNSAPVYAGQKFSDVPDHAWYAKAVNALTDGNLVEGYADGTFKPNKEVTLAELCVIMLRGLDLENPVENNYFAKAYFKDLNMLLPKNRWWADEYIAKARLLDLIYVYDAQNYKSNWDIPATREQTAIALYMAGYEYGSPDENQLMMDDTYIDPPETPSRNPNVDYSLPPEITYATILDSYGNSLQIWKDEILNYDPNSSDPNINLLGRFVGLSRVDIEIVKQDIATRKEKLLSQTVEEKRPSLPPDTLNINLSTGDTLKIRDTEILNYDPNSSDPNINLSKYFVGLTDFQIDWLKHTFSIKKEEYITKTEKYNQWASEEKMKPPVGFYALLDYNDASNQGILMRAYDVGIIQGMPDGKIYPQKTLTRAELCQMLYNINWVKPYGHIDGQGWYDENYYKEYLKYAPIIN
jgi:hypothetical protein